MAGGARAAAAGPRESDDLLALALSRPREALASARAVLAGRPGPHDASVAHQAAAIVLRDFGDVEAGVRELRQALRLARRTGSAEREADVLASLGVALVYAGRTTAGLAAFEAGLQRSSWCPGGAGAVPARDRARQTSAGIRRLWKTCGTRSPCCGARVTRSRRLARLTSARLAYLRLGSTSRADADFVSAVRLFAERRAGAGSAATRCATGRWSPSRPETSRPRWPTSMRLPPATGG